MQVSWRTPARFSDNDGWLPLLKAVTRTVGWVVEAPRYADDMRIGDRVTRDDHIEGYRSLPRPVRCHGPFGGMSGAEVHVGQGDDILHDDAGFGGRNVDNAQDARGILDDVREEGITGERVQHGCLRMGRKNAGGKL